MSVDVSVGDAIIPRSDGTYGHPAWNDAVYNQIIATADVSNPRRDIIVKYIDYGQTPTTASSNNINGVVKIKAVAGTPAGSPVDPTTSAIQSSVGAGNPFVVLARVRVGAGVATITNSVIDDLRIMAQGLLQGEWTYDDVNTWVFATSLSFTINGVDVRSQFPINAKISVLQGGVQKYFNVASTAFSTNTTITLVSAGGTGAPYALTNVPIDKPAYSYSQMPVGYPGTVKRVPMVLTTDATGGASAFDNYGREVKFLAGTGSAYGRANTHMPADYVPGTDAKLIFRGFSVSAQSPAFTYYVGSYAPNDDMVTTPWNVISAASLSAQSYTAKLLKDVTLHTIPQANLAAGKLIATAFKPSGTLAADLEVTSIVLEYTAAC
jgi:hypothetical protein